MAEVELTIAGRAYRVACRAGEEENLRAAGVLVDAKSKEAIADQIVDGREVALPAAADPDLVERAAKIAERLESLADALETSDRNA
jgi:cell division protein ZapA